MWPAAATGNFLVSPSVIDVRRGPGDALVGSFGVRIEQEGGSRFVVEVQDVAQRPDGGYTYRRPSASAFSASRWVAAFPRSFSGSPRRVQPVEYHLRVPRDAEPGDHVTSLTVKRIPRRGRGQAIAVQAISVRLMVRVPGPVRDGAQIQSLDAPRIASRGPVTTSALVRNTGNVRLDFDRSNKGSLIVTNGDSTEARLPFRGVLFPGQARRFELALQDPPLVGKLEARAGVTLRHRRATKTAGVWIFPWRQAAALILLAVAAGLIYLGRRHRRLRDGTQPG